MNNIRLERIKPILIEEKTRRGLSYRGMSRKLGIGDRLVGDRIANPRKIKFDDLADIADVMGITFRQLEFCIENDLEYIPDCFLTFCHLGKKHLPQGILSIPKKNKKYLCLNQLGDIMHGLDGSMEEVIDIFTENRGFLTSKYPDLFTALVEVLNSEELGWERKLRNDPTYLENPFGYPKLRGVAA